MTLLWKDIKIEMDDAGSRSLLASWDWLVPKDLSPILISSIGDMFLKNQNGQIYWLNVGIGCLDKVANSEKEFIVKINDDQIANEWFMFDLIQQLKEAGLHPTADQLFGYIILPIIGGKYTANNFELTQITEHFSYNGQIHKQLRDLPDGTQVNFEFI